MRLTLATLLLVASSPAWAGDLLVSDAPAAEPAAGGGTAAPAAARSAAPAIPAIPAAPAVPYAGLYDSPLFGHLAPAVDRVDETALRFYAGQKNRARVDAEIRRLRGLHPGWRVPANLYASGAGNDEQPLWDLFAAGRTEELRVAIQAREKREAGWRPSADLLAKMARAETAAQLKALSDARDWPRLLLVAAAHPDALSCSAVDLDWRVAEAFAALGAPERSYEVDAAILKNCRDRDERLATVRKAVDALPAADVDRLIAAGAVLADGSGEFDGVRLDLARRQVGRALSTAGAAGAAGVVDEIPAGDLEALGTATLRSSEPADAALLGWYAYRRARWAEADGWFKLALENSDSAGGDAKLAEGHALALKELGRPGEAERLAHAWRERSAVLRGLFVSLLTARLATADAAAVDPAEMADLSSLVVADRSAEAAGALGWAAYGRGDLDDAALWFGRAVDWCGTGPDAGPVPDKVAEGWGLTLKRLGRFDAAEDFLYARIQAGPDRAAAARELYVAVAVSALSGGPLPGTVGPDLPVAAVSPERMDRFAEVIRDARSAAGAAALGWRALHDGRPAEAVDRFRDALVWSTDGAGNGAAKAAKNAASGAASGAPAPADLAVLDGLVLALKDAGRLAEAEDAAYPHIRDSARLRDSYRNVMVAQLSAPALAGRLPPERVLRFADLTLAESSSAGAEALGWYRLNGDGGKAGDGACGYAVEWFRRAAAWSPNRTGTSAATAKADEGLAQALARAGHPLAADDVLSAWVDRSPDLRALDVKLMADALTRDLFPAAVDEGRLSRFAALVRAERSATGAQAMGWHRYRDAGAGYGVDWFADAVRWSPDRRPDTKTVEGYASALRDVGRLAEAEEALFPFADRVPVMRDLYIDTVVSELTLDDPPEPMPHDRLARFIAVATPLRSAAAAQAIGWYRFARREYGDAAIWFKLAVDWWPALPAEADRYTYVPEGFRPALAHLALRPEDYRRTPRAFTGRVHGPDASEHRYVDTFGGLATTWAGYALTLDALGRAGEAEDIAFAWRDRWPALGRLFVDFAIRALTRTADACGAETAASGGSGDVTPERLKRFAAVIEEERDAGGAAALGWAATARHDPAEAAVWLKAAVDWRPTDAALDGRAMAGYVAALRASGRAEEAYAAASAWAEAVPEVKAGLLDAALDVLSAGGRAAAARAPKPAGYPSPAPSPTPSPTPSPEALARAIALAQADGSARGPAALGWHHLGANRPDLALAQFKLAIERAEDAEKAAGPAAASAAAPGACRLPGADAEADALPKAVEGYALALRAAGRDADALTFAEAWSARWGAKAPALAALPGDIVADVVGRDGAADGKRGALPPDVLDRMAGAARRARSVPAAASFGWSAYRRRDWDGAAAWFAEGIAWSPDRRGSAKLVEGYAASLHNACRFAEAERAALSRAGDGEDADADARLRDIYVDSVADRVSRAGAGTALAPADAARFAANTVAASSPNGAQALGWYAYRSRQFGAAAAWFEKALAWRPNEAQAYGLALSYRRLGDAAGLSRTLSSYEARYPSLGAVRRAGLGGREPPVPDFGDLARRGCAPGTDARAAQVPQAATVVHAVLAGTEVVPAVPADGATAPLFRGRPVVVAAVETGPAADRDTRAERSERAARFTAGPARPAVHPARPAAPAAASARRARLVEGEPRIEARIEAGAEAGDAMGDGSTARALSAPSAPSAPFGSAAAALAARDYPRCLSILARRPSLSAGDRETEGWCLLGAGRPAEAAGSFRAAGVHASGRAAGDSALGETLSDLAGGDTAAAVGSAGRASTGGLIGAGRRRELGLQILSQQALDAYRAGRWAEVLDLLRRRSGFAREPRDLTLLRGWSLYHGGDLAAARAAFTSADALLSDRDSRNALATVETAATPRPFR